MKKAVSLVLALLMIAALFTITVSAEESKGTLISQTVENLENGDYVVTELYESAIQPRTGKSGSKTSTYYSGGTAIWAVTVQGTFTYTYGVSSSATGSTAYVNTYSSSATYIGKNAYYTGSTATASGTVKYNNVTNTRSVSVSCDKYGNLS